MDDLSWKITGLVTTSTGGVYQATWEASKELDGVVGVFSGASEFELPTKKTKGFIKLEDLTEDVVVGWVKKGIEGNEMFIAHINNSIDAKLNAPAKQELTEDMLPWAPKLEGDESSGE